MRLAVLSIALVFPLFTGCKGEGGETIEPPRGVDIMGNRIRTPNVAGAVCGWLFDNDQDDEVDGSMGRVTIVGTTWDTPCDIVETGNPPEGQTLDLIIMEAQFSDLPWDTVVAEGLSGENIWDFGTTYTADGSDQNILEVDAWEIDTGEVELEAGGPPMGDVTLIDQNQFGLHVNLNGMIGYVNHTGGETQSSGTPEDFSIDWEDVPMCPVACDTP